MVDAMVANKLHSDVTSTSDVPYLPITFQPPLNPPPPQVKSSSPQHRGSPNRVIPANDTITPENEEDELTKNEADEPSSQDILSDYIFHNEYYMTQVRNTNSQHLTGIHPKVQHWLKHGRPNLPDIFERTAQLCQKENISRVGVCVCGPSTMVNETVDLCHASLLNPSCSGVRFDCHCEVFDF